MEHPNSNSKGTWSAGLIRLLRGPATLAFMPALCLSALWLGGEGALLAVAAGVPVLYLFVLKQEPSAPYGPLQPDMITGLIERSHLDAVISGTQETARENHRQSAIFQIEIEGYSELVERHGQAAADDVMTASAQRVLSALRDRDVACRCGDSRFSVVLSPVRQLDLELCIQLAGRLQATLEEPLAVDGTTLYVSASIGFCQLSRSPGKDGSSWHEAANIAMREAKKKGPSGIRAFSDQMRRFSESQAELREEVANALEAGQIQPWFQPQISTDTGQITGFEALARWQHPERGQISPADFLPAIEAAGLLERLMEIMMYHSFAALKAWDNSGVSVPQVGVNFSGSELNNPRLIEKITWELDRFDLSPDRLAIEILETVVADAPNDMITRNINGLGKMGCRIDLDDFGTGNASIAAIRRFAVSRIKIDRSFVMKADRDPEQQKMISAILTMAERLEVETLAEGVETVGEHVLLAQLGCTHVQGFGISRPLPFEKTLDWIAAHESKLNDVPRIMGGKSGS